MADRDVKSRRQHHHNEQIEFAASIVSLFIFGFICSLSPLLFVSVGGGGGIVSDILQTASGFVLFCLLYTWSSYRGDLLFEDFVPAELSASRSEISMQPTQYSPRLLQELGASAATSPKFPVEQLDQKPRLARTNVQSMSSRPTAEEERLLAESPDESPVVVKMVASARRLD